MSLIIPTITNTAVGTLPLDTRRWHAYGAKKINAPLPYLTKARGILHRTSKMENQHVVEGGIDLLISHRTLEHAYFFSFSNAIQRQNPSVRVFDAKSHDLYPPLPSSARTSIKSAHHGHRRYGHSDLKAAPDNGVLIDWP